MIKIPNHLMHDDVARDLARFLDNIAHESSSVTIDLSTLNKFDSSALALFLTIKRKLREKSLDASFVRVPMRFLELAKLYGVADILQFPDFAATPMD